MTKVESKRFGMALVGDSVHSDVLQTAVNFTDHQVLSPNLDENGARQALKCLIFKSLLSYIQASASAAKSDAIERDTRLKSLRSRLQHSVDKADEEANRAELEARIAMLEYDIELNGLRAASLDSTLTFVAEVFSKPTEYLSASTESIRLSRVGVKLDVESTEAGYDVSMFQVSIGSRTPRVMAVVHFLRRDLLPRQDFVAQADLFLSL